MWGLVGGSSSQGGVPLGTYLALVPFVPVFWILAIL